MCGTNLNWQKTSEQSPWMPLACSTVTRNVNCLPSVRWGGSVSSDELSQLFTQSVPFSLTSAGETEANNDREEKIRCNYNI